MNIGRIYLIDIFRFLLILLGMISVVSCSRQDPEVSFVPLVFPDSTHLEGTIIDSTFVVGLSYDIDYYDSCIIVVAHRGEVEPLIHLFDMEEKKYFASLFPKGRGPGERLSWGNIGVDHISGEVLFFDNQSQKTSTFYVDSVRYSKKTWREQVISCNHPVYAYSVVKRKDGYIMHGGLGDSPDGRSKRFSLLKNDSVVDIYYDTPAVYFPEGYLTMQHISNEFLYGISPDRKRIICAMNYGILLEFFRIEEDRIMTDTVRGFVKPLFKLDRQKFVRSVEGKTIFGFRDIYTTDQYVYTVFIGNPIYKKSSRIAVFDWKGNPLHLFTTDYQLEHICVDETNKKIYATGVTSAYENVLLEFPLLLDSLK